MTAITHLLDYTAPTPAENLAIDEALLIGVNNGKLPPTLRFWESDVYFVVLGYSSSLIDDVNRDTCTLDNIPILRRISGGGTVLQGRGCLNYAIVTPHIGEQSLIDGTQIILSAIAAALSPLAIKTAGISDLLFNGKKFSGNAERRKKNARLFHGTLLYNFSIPHITRYLKIPPKQPRYREGKPHAEFVVNLPYDIKTIKTKLIQGFECTQTLTATAIMEASNPLIEKYTVL